MKKEEQLSINFDSNINESKNDFNLNREGKDVKIVSFLTYKNKQNEDENLSIHSAILGLAKFFPKKEGNSNSY